MNPPQISGLYAITPDTADSSVLLCQVSAALQGGINVLQYRNKSSDAGLRLNQARGLQALCRAAGVPFLINDDVELACAIAADGVHLGNDDGDLVAARQQLGHRAIIGASCYDQLTLASQAVAAGVDYVAFGSMFSSPTKPAARRASLELLLQARAMLKVPIVAIGGIDMHTIGLVARSGASAAAVIQALFGQGDAGTNAARLRHVWLSA